MPAFDPRMLTMQMRMVMTMKCVWLQMMAWIDLPVTLLRKKKKQPWITVIISRCVLEKSPPCTCNSQHHLQLTSLCNWHHHVWVVFAAGGREPRNGFELRACLQYMVFEIILLPSSHYGFMWESLTNPEVMIFWPKVYHCEKVEMQSIMWSDGQPRWEDLQDMSELAELAKALEEPAVKNLPIVEVGPLTPLLKALTVKEERPPNSLKVEVGSPKRSRSPRIQKRGRIDWSHPEVRKVVDDDANVRWKLSFDKCVGGQWGVQMGRHWLLFFIWNEWTSLIIRNLKLNRLRGTKGAKHEHRACSEPFLEVLTSYNSQMKNNSHDKMRNILEIFWLWWGTCQVQWGHEARQWSQVCLRQVWWAQRETLTILNSVRLKEKKRKREKDALS